MDFLRAGLAASGGGRNRPRKGRSPAAYRPARGGGGGSDASPLPPDEGSGPPSRQFCIVGIGASAGGIAAISTFLEHMPRDSGLGFVVVLHLDPQKESRAAEVLAPHTDMAVVQAQDGMKVQPNRVHVIVPDRSLTISQGTLHLTRLSGPRGDRHPIDTFFETLAEDQREKAVAIVFSGSGSNGSLGVRAIRAQGGVTFVQDPETAEFSGMPGSAIGVGGADYILAPEAIPETLLRYVNHPYVRVAGRAASLEAQEAERLTEILSILHTRGAHDFRGYRKATIMRRIQRRMGLAHTLLLKDYAALLRDNPAEVEALVRDVMINVTGFFRDPEAWEALRTEVIVGMVAAGDQPIRAWVPACATGAEAYSLGMLLLEEQERIGKKVDMKIFATDAASDTLLVARRGVYPASMVADVPPERLARFFERENDTYQVKPELRDLLVIAQQNLLQDPPFSKLDLVSCRNVLIYLEPEIQSRLLALFHYTLRAGGYLFLGASETVGRELSLFAPVVKKWRIYRGTGSPQIDRIRLPLGGQRTKEPTTPAPDVTGARVPDLARQALVERYAPAAVVIDGTFHVLHVEGATDPYLVLPQGVPSTDLLALVREGLRSKLRAVVQGALEKGQPASTADAHARRGEQFHRVVIEAIPLRHPTRRQVLVTFRDYVAPADAVLPTLAPQEPLQRDLEKELEAARDELQNTVDQLETSNEELRASNEEVVAINEELQSANEELETSKEELQSLNEELSTLNAQLQAKVDELENSRNDLSNLLANTEVAMIFLDPQFRIRNFTPAANRVFDLLPTDVGRPIVHLAQKFAGRDLMLELRAVLNRLVPLEAEVTAGGRVYLRRTLPYRTRDHRIDGVVVTFVDITERIVAERAIASSKEYADRIVETVGVGLVVLDAGLRVKSGNRWFYETFGTRPEDTIGHVFWEVGCVQWHTRDVPLERVLSEGTSLEDVAVEVELENGGRRSMMLDARVLTPGESLLVAIRDVTEHRRFTEQLTALNRGLELRMEQRSAIVQLVVEQIASAANQAKTLEEALAFTMARIAEHQGWVAGHAYVRRSGGSLWLPSEAWYVREGYDLGAFKLATMRQRVARGEGPIGRVAATGQPMWFENTGGDPRWTGTSFWPKAAIFFPVLRRQKTDVDAVFEFYSDTPFEPDPAFLALMANVGIQMAHVFERKELERQLATFAEQEQRRIGRELHDKVGQSVSAVAMLARSLQRKLDAQPAASPEDLTRLLEAADEAKVQLRLVARALLPDELGGRGLAHALEDLAAHYNALHGNTVRFVGDDGDGPAEEPAMQLFRIAQEAVLNAAQHASARDITIRLYGEDGHTVLEVRDDGAGFDAEAKAGGMGLRVMRHRANLIGARLEITSGKSGGTLVRCIVANDADDGGPSGE